MKKQLLARSESDSSCGMYFCEKCGKEYKSKGTMKRHMTVECGKEPNYSCPICRHKFYYRDKCLQHIRLVHRDLNLFPMEVILPKDNDELSKMLLLSCDPPSRVIYPDKPKQAKPVDRRHQFLPEMEKFQCNSCGRSYKWRQSLERHLKHECGKDPVYSCLQCKFQAKHKTSLQRHFESFHAACLSTQPQCNFCGRSYKWRQSLERHLKHECGKDPVYSCSQCKFQAKHKTSLQRHFLSFHAACLSTQPQIIVQQPRSNDGNNNSGNRVAIASQRSEAEQTSSCDNINSRNQLGGAGQENTSDGRLNCIDPGEHGTNDLINKKISGQQQD
ncbi:zinc finger protein 2-like [Nilaparvata lugens]|uniref:zinc finger protein 2-like n=1 Tax=Nilaparvata lugens TaxID=108931 RepID=UPI00193D22FB|nr:zinc finger protein 2-like [Nilaparvata lugens]XP_039284608.1 zinc finger protein 2-like [Nilaparvata lugens]